MSVPTQWEGPPTEAGPAPGVEWGTPGSRLVGYIIDMFVVVGAVLTMAFLAVILGALGLGILTGLILFISIFVPIIYFPYFWKSSGQTPGMKMMGIRVVRDRDGGPLGWGAAILRLIGYAISSMVFYIGFIWILIDKRKRGWFDLIAGTCVIKGEVEEYGGDPFYGAGLPGAEDDPGRRY
jgi:uncharacterized RDD family membrane protein YckC